MIYPNKSLPKLKTPILVIVQDDGAKHVVRGYVTRKRDQQVCQLALVGGHVCELSFYAEQPTLFQHHVCPEPKVIVKNNEGLLLIMSDLESVNELWLDVELEGATIRAFLFSVKCYMGAQHEITVAIPVVGGGGTHAIQNVSLDQIRFKGQRCTLAYLISLLEKHNNAVR